MRLEIENQIFFFNLVNKGHKVDIFNKEISSIDFFYSRTERVKTIHGDNDNEINIKIGVFLVKKKRLEM